MSQTSLPFRPHDRAVLLPGADALVLADLHLGRGEEAAVALPLTGSVVERLTGLVSRLEPTTVVLAGDVVHSFAGPSAAVVEAFEALRGAVGNARLRVVSGNHDTRLGELCDPVECQRLTDGTVVCHGHEDPGVAADRYVIGHDHPAIEIEGKRRPCYLYGEAVYRGADVIALPAFNPLARGTTVNRLRNGDPASPFLADLGAFSPVVRDSEVEETYVFPALSASRAYL